MTFPCVDDDFFDTTDGVLSPLRKYQMQRVAAQTIAAASFTPANNTGGTTLQTNQISWLNDTGITQQVHAVMTQGPSRYVIDGIKKLVIRTQWGTSAGASPADPTLSETSQFTGYPNMGTTVISSTTVAIYIQLEDRQPTLTTPIGDVVTLPAGQTMKAKAVTSWLTTQWGVDWLSAYGDPAAIRFGQVGALTLELFAVPVIP